ncbi:FGFR1 oncogene partner 2 homolog isoform X1 [Limulus polyphemus]|uniref:FGFR1 oncogene partner 2 homolog isoform X1 n=1 Tax=Limulus polyphemus TaxID=6850 RepID=A0ABM1BQT5_LIMPO|nr:FGFR1 oncogene partner 2 homolog isoform X1 [Limulus polyphemus]
MSLTVQQILSDAKRLVSRLREHDTSADALIAQTQMLNKHIESVKVNNEELTELTTSIEQRPLSLCTLNVQQENRHIRELQQENQELRSLVEEHQSALDHIMRKYRKLVTSLLEENSVKWDKLCSSDSEMMQEKLDQICEMVAVMRKAVDVDEVADIKSKELLAQLQTENKVLKELVYLSKSAGSLSNLLLETVDEEVQTDS